MVVPPQQPFPPAVTRSNTSTTTPLALGGSNLCYELMLEILSRVGAKSLMRFKCVCKSWLYLIREDKHLISLHSSKSHKKLLISCLGIDLISFYTLDYFEKRSEYLTSFPPEFDNNHTVRSVYGLLCFVRGHSFKIYNLFTREETTTWTESHFGKKNPKYQSLYFGFGFDTITKQHKVLFIWTTNHPQLTWVGDEVPFCEVFPVGENSWRRIDNVPRMKGLSRKPDYVANNGSIYWLRKPPSISGSIIEFDVGNEKFRVIDYPDSVINVCRFHDTCDLLEVDGHLGLLDKRTYCSEEEEKQLREMNLWIFMENENENNNHKSSGRWIEEKIEFPFNVISSDSFESIPGTDMIMATPEGYNRALFIYVYDRKKKELNNYTSLSELGVQRYSELTHIVESIYPVQTPNN